MKKIATKTIGAVLSLKDNMSATLREARREQKSFQRQVAQTRKSMESVNKQKLRVRLDSTNAHKNLKKLRKKIAPLRNKVVTAVAIKDNIKNKLNRKKQQLKKFSKKTFAPVIKLRDRTGGIFKKIKKKLTSLKGLGAIALGGAALGGTLASGAALENQNVSMNHFMGAGNKGKSASEVKKMSSDYIKKLRGSANSTPFETGEILAVGARSLQVSGGNATEAMKQVQMAEDMAAMNPGKSVSDAMEALADAKNGEMERLKEFGVKAGKNDSFEDVKGKLNGLYKGGAGKLAGTAGGMLSTIKGKGKSMIADTGLAMLEKMKPLMADVIAGMDKIAPKVGAVGTIIADGLGVAVNFVKDNLPALEPVFNTFSTVASEAGKFIGVAFVALKPVFKGLGVVALAVFNGIGQVIATVLPYVTKALKGLTPVFEKVGGVLTTLGGKFKSTFNAIKEKVRVVCKFVEDKIQSIKNTFETIKGIYEKGKEFMSGGSGTPPVPYKNATGTNYYQGGFTTVGEHGPELLNLPRGSKILSNSNSKSFVKKQNLNSNIENKGQQVIVKINKMAENVYVDKEVDADKLFAEFIYKLKTAGVNLI